MSRLIRPYRILVLGLSFLLFFALASVVYTWFVLINRTDSFIATAAKVDVEYNIYLNASEVVEPDFVSFFNGAYIVKSGIYTINVSNIDADDYINNLRVDIKVNGTIDLYVRVKVVDALSLATIDFQGVRGEVAVVDQPINYAFNRTWLVNDIFYEDIYDAEVALGGITAQDEVIPQNVWYDNTKQDGYYYYPSLIERTTDSPTLTIPFIEAYDGDEFDTKSVGYFLQFAIIVEAIQAAHNAPAINWGIDTPPWGGVWA